MMRKDERQSLEFDAGYQTASNVFYAAVDNAVELSRAPLRSRMFFLCFQHLLDFAMSVENAFPISVNDSHGSFMICYVFWSS